MAEQPPYEHEDNYPEESGGHPLIATLICTALLLGGSATPATALANRAEVIGYIFMAGVFGLILWAIAYAITIKRSTTGWKVGTAIVLAVVGAFSGVLKVAGANQELRQDAAEVAQQMEGILNASDPTSARIVPGKGPIARTSAAILNAIIDDSRTFDQESESAGLDQVISFEGLTKTSPVLSRCDAVEALDARAQYYRDRWPAYMAAGRQVSDAAVRNGEIGAAAIDGFYEGMERGRPQLARKYALVAQAAKEAGAICRVLARRRWVMKDRTVLFDNDRDLAEANGHLSKVRAIAAEVQSLERQSRGNLQQSLPALKQ